MRRTSKRLNVLVGGTTGLVIALGLWFVELQIEDFKLFFTTFIGTGALAGLVVGEVNRKLIKIPRSLDEKELYLILGSLKQKYSAMESYSVEALTALNEVQLSMEERHL